jgi:hypothetical protein
MKEVAVGLSLAVVFVLVGAFLLSNSLETLDAQAEKLAIEGGNILHAPFQGYNIAGLENAWGTLIAGIGGIAVIFAVTLVIANVLKKKTKG